MTWRCRRFEGRSAVLRAIGLLAVVGVLTESAGAQQVDPEPYLYRIAGPDHLYTTSGDEAWYALTQAGYSWNERVEALVWNTGGGGRIPVYRLYRQAGSWGAHYYTSVPAERDYLVANAGFAYEGIAFWAYSTRIAGTYPLYRIDRTYQPARYFMWWLVSPERSEDHVLTMRSSEVANATANLGYTTNNYFGYLVGYVWPGWNGVD